MSSEHTDLLETLKQELRLNVERWAAEGLVQRYSDPVASARAESVTIEARMWFDPDDSSVQSVLRAAVVKLFLALGHQHGLRGAILTIDDPEGAHGYDYLHRGGNLRMIFAQPRNRGHLGLP